MSVKIYWTAWALCAAAAFLLFAAGAFTAMTAVILGFISFGLTFMGMMAVLPATIAHPDPSMAVQPAPVLQNTYRKTSVKAYGAMKAA